MWNCGTNGIIGMSNKYRRGEQDCKNSGKFKYRKGRGIVTLKLEGKKKYLMYVCGSDTDRAKEPEITAQIAAFF